MTDIKRVRIVNEGGPAYATKITNEETGEEIPRVTNVEIHINGEELMPIAIITTGAPQVDVIADIEKIVERCPYCGHETIPAQSKKEQI